jgi:hypothetical protein
MVSWTDDAVGLQWTKGGVNMRHIGASSAHGTPGGTGLRSSLTEVGEGEGDEAMPMRGSPGHGQRQRSIATSMEDGGGELLVVRALESGRLLESEGKWCGEGPGWCSPFYRAEGGARPFIGVGGRWGGGCRGVTTDV